MCSNPFSLETQQTTPSPGSNKNTPPLCVVIDNQSDKSSINNPVVGEPPPIPMFALRPQQTRQDNCSAFACQLYSHTQHLPFQTRVEFAAWCQSKIKIKILWQLNPITLQKTASTRLCQLCAPERIIIGHNCIGTNRWNKIINLKSEMRGECSCKTRLRFLQSDWKGGFWWRWKPKNRAGELLCMEGCIMSPKKGDVIWYRFDCP